MATKKHKARQMLKYAPRHKGVIQEEELPPIARDYIVKYRQLAKKRRRAIKAVWDLDTKVWLHKYYPWSYNNYLPTLVLQGWYNENKAKKAYLRVYGPEALRYVKFIKGKDALERDFKVGHNLYINGRWRYIPGKSSMMPNKYGNNTKDTITKRIPGSTTHLKRKNLDRELPYYHNGSREIIFENKPIKTARLQKSRKIDTERKKDLYEEE